MPPTTVVVRGVTVPVGNHKEKTVVLASDHRGYDLRMKIGDWLVEQSYAIVDLGTRSRERCDYPAFSDELGRRISQDASFSTVGIGICGSGIGILIPASKHPGVYHARCLGKYEAGNTRRHNNTNLLGLAADANLDTTGQIEIVRAWLETPFDQGPQDAAYLERYVQTVELERKLRGI